MKQLFQIDTDKDINNSQKVLSIRLGEKHGSFAITNKPGSELFLLTYCTTEDMPAGGWNENTLTTFFNSNAELNNSFYEVMVCYEYSQSVLVPLKDFNYEDAGLLLKTLYESSGKEVIVSEPITEWQLCNIYAVPKEVQDWMGRKFPSGKYWHQHSLAIKMMYTADSNGCLGINFGNEEFTLTAAKAGQFLMAQTFVYSTPGDVVYYLLKTCLHFSLSQQEVQVQLSGLIDKQSALYKELHQYFINVVFRDAEWSIPASEYPAHFFTTLNDLAKCAS